MQTDEHIALAALHTFSEDQTLSFLWADRLGVITRKLGKATESADVGQFLSDVLPVFHGLEADLAQLMHNPDEALDLPNIAIVSRNTGPLQRLNVSVRWDVALGEYVILVAKALSRAAFEIELQQQVRARRLAEEIMLEQADSIRLTNTELARVNEDLADFARLVTHDLKAPMRAMRYFADDLETSLTDPTSGDARAHIDRLRAQSRRMTSMLSSLLTYATVERKADAVAAFDSRAVIDAVVASLPRPPAVGIVVAGQWPHIETIEALFDMVMRNLVENAIRFAQAGDDAIVVDAEIAAQQIVIRVADNGHGIADADRAAVFKPFTQLSTDPDAEAAGHTGMGLAVVKRAVETVGGQIALEPHPNGRSGACFVVTWPYSSGRHRN